MKLDLWFLHLDEYFEGLLNDQVKKYASFDLHGMEPSMQENGQKKFRTIVSEVSSFVSNPVA